ncbi:hypothetical protein ACUXCC_003254 [Cytobacillus horneckiae]|uniref:hypothetical protein n=1 Tax=Cytobacillus horneckiae TaxID=549687 RepID=UPI0019D158D9|nr:hypothetical protein [Cytobacillus horneckiae]MBN6889119.1 hypothetical protein [Cytobacillus horneckiae]NRG43695.1 hypothetical protein [Bacillus sp. CRN 9]
MNLKSTALLLSKSNQSLGKPTNKTADLSTTFMQEFNTVQANNEYSKEKNIWK